MRIIRGIERPATQQRRSGRLEIFPAYDVRAACSGFVSGRELGPAFHLNDIIWNVVTEQSVDGSRILYARYRTDTRQNLAIELRRRLIPSRGNIEMEKKQTVRLVAEINALYLKRAAKHQAGTGD